MSFSSDKSEKSVSSARRRTSSTDTVSTDGGNKPKSAKNKAKKKEKKKKWSRSFFVTHECKFVSFVKLRIPQWLKHFKYSRSCMLQRYSWVYKARNTLALTMRLTHPFLLMLYSTFKIIVLIYMFTVLNAFHSRWLIFNFFWNPEDPFGRNSALHLMVTSIIYIKWHWYVFYFKLLNVKYSKYLI